MCCSPSFCTTFFINHIRVDSFFLGGYLYLTDSTFISLNRMWEINSWWSRLLLNFLACLIEYINFGYFIPTTKQEYLCRKKICGNLFKREIGNNGKLILFSWSFWVALTLAIVIFPLRSVAGNIGKPKGMTYHNGSILTGEVNLSMLWLGKINEQQKSCLKFFN